MTRTRARRTAFASPSLVAASLTIAAALPAYCQTASPQPSPVAERGVCLARVGVIAPISGTTSYALRLETLGDSPGVASGTVAIFSGNLRFDVPFHSIIAAPARTFGAASPLVVRFPAPLRVEAGYISSVEGPNGGPCVPFPLQYVGIPKNAPVGAADAFLLRATAAKPIDAPPGVPLAPPDCSVPNREAATRHIEPPPALSAPAAQIASSSLRANVVNVEVEVIIDDLGRVFTARLFTASRIRDLDEGAVYAARHTTYEPGRFRCLPVGGEYKFVVQYVLPMPS